MVRSSFSCISVFGYIWGSWCRYSALVVVVAATLHLWLVVHPCYWLKVGVGMIVSLKMWSGGCCGDSAVLVDLR